MEKVETNEKETNKTDHELFNTFAQFILRLKTQESYYLVEKMIKLNKILPNFVINKDTYIFAHRFNMKNFNDFYSYFSDNHEELSKNDWELHKKFIEEGVNQSEISKIIRNDEIEKLQEISSQNDFDFNQKIKPSLYERCSFINHYNVTLIDYAAFFGSVKCFKYLLMNNAKVENTGKYAVAGGNEEIIHLCEQNHSSFIGAFEAAIMFHRNDIFHYFYDNNFLKYSINEIGELFLFPKNDIVNFKLFNFILENKEVDIYTKNNFLFYLKFILIS